MNIVCAIMGFILLQVYFINEILWLNNFCFFRVKVCRPGITYDNGVIELFQDVSYMVDICDTNKVSFVQLDAEFLDTKTMAKVFNCC